MSEQQSGDDRPRCFWAGSDPLYVDYHDREWGRPMADDNRLFEKLCLEGFQSGLAWITVLRKRERFREVFHGFVIDRVAAMDEADIERLVLDAGIIRHRGKIASTINNAKRAQAVRQEFGSLAAYIWRFEPKPEHRPDRLTLETLKTMAETDASRALGPTTCYAFMQAMGLVDDHLEECFCRAEVEVARAAFKRPG
jgi:DNA-3-methyladenine glycosylase I